MNAGTFAAVAIALYAAHHVGDYWVQRDVDARHKADAGADGRLHCLHHVVTYVATQEAFLLIMSWTLGIRLPILGVTVGLLVSGVTHYVADRREPLKRLAALIPGKAEFARLGIPRSSADNPQLATGLWALDQSWHIFWGVFVAALIMARVS